MDEGRSISAVVVLGKSMTPKLPCGTCGEPFLIELDQCPHCGTTALPHIRMAELSDELEALEERYRKAVNAAEARGCGAVTKAFEEALNVSEAAIARSVLETERMASSDDKLYATFYQLVEARIQIPQGSKWDRLRSMADITLFGDIYRKEIRFAALTLDGVGLSNYGECSWILREDFIARRAAVFEENTVLFFDKVKANLPDLPKGHRATWSNRARLGVAKLAERLSADAGPEIFPEVLLSHGRSTEDDDFIEVHIGGPMTVRTLSRVVATKPMDRGMFRKLKRQLAGYGVEMEARGWTP